jgi:hypothetical protein
MYIKRPTTTEKAKKVRIRIWWNMLLQTKKTDPSSPKKDICGKLRNTYRTRLQNVDPTIISLHLEQ